MAGIGDPKEEELTNALLGQWQHLAWVAAKAGLLFVVVVVALRLSPRRTLSQLSVYDFVTAIAVGSIVGRVPNASDTSFVEGAVTLLVVLVLNRIVGATRVSTRLGRFLDRKPVVLAREGQTDEGQFRREHLTAGDLTSMLRAKGINGIGENDYVIFEPGGAVSVVSAAIHNEIFPSDNSRD